MIFKRYLIALFVASFLTLPSHSFNLLELTRADKIGEKPVIDYGFSFHRWYGIDHLLIGFGKRGDESDFKLGYMFISKKKDFKIDKVVFTINGNKTIESSTPYPYTFMKHKMANALVIYLLLTSEHIVLLENMNSMSIQHFYSNDKSQNIAGKKINLSKSEIKKFKKAQTKLISIATGKTSYQNDDEDDASNDMYF